MKKNYVLHFYSLCLLGIEALTRKNVFTGIILLLFGMNFFAQSQTKEISEALAKNNSPWLIKGLQNEILTSRTRTTKHFLNNKNQITSFNASGSIHYKNEAETWEEIDNKIVPNNGSNALTHPYMSLKNSVKTWFPMNPFSNYLFMSTKEGNYKERVKAINLLDANKAVIGSINLVSQISVSVNDNKITYSGFCTGLTLEYNLGNDSRKFDLIVHSANFFNSLPLGVKYLSIEEEFVSDDLNSNYKLENNEVIIETKGVEVFMFHQPVAFDSNNLDDLSSKGELSARIENKGLQLNSDFKMDWLKDANRTFPLHLDPTADYYPQFSTYWTGYQTSSSSKTSGYLRITNGSTASWAKFDLSSLPPGCTVTQAIYFGYHYSTTSTAKICDIRSMAAVDPVSASASVIFTQANTGSSYNSNYTYGGSTYSWNPGSLGGTALSDIASAAGGTFAVGMSYNSGSTTFMYHYGVNGNSSNICYLEVDYFTVPCSTTPDTNSVVTPSYAICPGTSITLGLSNTYSVGGITYQWQSSTTSSVGPFTSVPGATNAVFITPTLNTQTWFTSVITCTNAGLPINAVSGVVLIQATTIDTIPYFEGFEQIAADNKLPNCSWSASNLGSTVLTYTSSNPNGRVPRTGNNYASFYYNPGGVKEFYTNGLQLLAGVTYSASLWFKTEYYGYNNWSDLSILIGTTQSSAGSTTIASTNGPAISNVYKSLSDTFSVASSGVYYLCVRGTGGTSSSAQYLTWDDLEVIVPCELNSPSIALLTNSTVICAGESVNISAFGADSYFWSNGDIGSSMTDQPLQSITYTVIATNSLSGCSVEEIQSVTVNPTPLVFVYSDKTTVCAGSNANLSALGSNLTYFWNTGEVGSNIIVSPTVASSYSVLVTNAEGCTNQAAIQIGIYNLPNVQVTSVQQDGICAGESATLNASGALTYTWVSNVSQVLLSGNSIVVSPLASVIYTITGLDNNECENYTSISLQVSECTGILKSSKDVDQVSVFPNPTNGELNIWFTTILNRQIAVIDLAGRVIMEISTQDTTVNLNLNEFADGIYFLRYSDTDAVKNVKIVKTH